MAKKKQHNPPKPKEFQAAPFATLKGLVVHEHPPAAAPAVKSPPVQTAPENSADLFFQAVADVRPLHGTGKKPVKAGTHPQQQAAKKSLQELEVREAGAFLEEIGKLKLDSKFADAIPDDGELQPLSGNRLRQVKQGIVTVDHQLDLHGLTREEALEALQSFLRSARRRGQKAVLVITGKGIHSPDEPVLQQAVASWLRDTGRQFVTEFAPAPREMGGNGAFVIFLRAAESGSPATGI